MGDIVEYPADQPIYDKDGNQIGEEEVIEYHQVGNMPCTTGLRTVRWDGGEVTYNIVLFWHVHTAWRPLMRPDVNATPVTHAGAEDGAYILYPDGKVRNWDEVWDTLDDWVDDQKQFREQQRQFEEEKAAKQKDENIP